MRLYYTPCHQRDWELFFKQQGHGLTGFSGLRYQRGAGFGQVFSGLFRSILPLARRAGQAIGKTALKTGLNVAADTLDGEPLLDSLGKHGKEGAASLLRRGARAMVGKKKKGNQKGRGLGKRPRASIKPLKTIKRQQGRKKAVKKKKKFHDQLGSYFA